MTHHQSALHAALNEARKMQADGIADTNTILTACMVVYASKLIEVTEPMQLALQKRTFRLFVLLSISMSINLLFSLIADEWDYGYEPSGSLGEKT
jgi:uncharacterized YccA/Bax inhibitor family protein